MYLHFDGLNVRKCDADQSQSCVTHCVVSLLHRVSAVKSIASTTSAVIILNAA